jgi:hypothetical protein
MTTKHSSPTTIGHKTWVAIRFGIFGIGGAAVLLFFLMDFAEAMAKNLTFVSPQLSLPLAIVGVIMMVFGAGAWGRWAYLWVFLSIPSGMGLWVIFPHMGWRLGLFLVAAPLLGSYSIVRRYYRHCDQNMRPSSHDAVSVLTPRLQEPK